MSGPLPLQHAEGTATGNRWAKLTRLPAMEMITVRPTPASIHTRGRKALSHPPARVGRLRERLKAYLQDRKPLALDGLELGFFPTKGRYDAAAVFRAATDAGTDPWALLAADGRTLAAFLKRWPGVEQTLAGAWTPSPAWFGHRKTKNATRGAGDPGGVCATDTAVRETQPGPRR
jgi:hypothetical protein